MSKEKHFKIYDRQEPIKLIEFLNDGTINFANDEVKMIFEEGVKHAQSKVNNSVLDDVSKQSELLKAFIDFYNYRNTGDKTIYNDIIEIFIDSL